MSKNGMASYDRTVNYVNLTHLPTPKREYTINFEKLTGGLNLYAPDYRLNLNESPDMENMLWKNGTLCSRYGQDYLVDSSQVADVAEGAIGYTCASELFHGCTFFHIGKCIYSIVAGGTRLRKHVDLSSSTSTATVYGPCGPMYGSRYQPARGTFLRYGEDLFYKAPGVFIRISSMNLPQFPYYFTINRVDSDDAYTPITYINADYRNGSGDPYQPENRLSAKKTIWYNAGSMENTKTLSGDGTTTSFTFSATNAAYITDVTVDGQSVGNWTYSITHPGTYDTVALDFYIPPAAGTNNITVKLMCAADKYYLPVKDSNTRITYLEVYSTEHGWQQFHEDEQFTFVPATGEIEFYNIPEVTQPLSSNTVRVTYSLANSDALNSIMDCPYAIVYGGNQNICMVVGGCKAQPNAFFWNGNNVSMDVSYWPMENYNLGGDTEDAITGFGRQQGQLVVFKNNSVGKVSMDLTTISASSDTTARVYIEMDYTQINSRIGCDLPWTIQLIDNNLVFCNSRQGVQYIKDSSSAYENNIITISTKVNGDNGRDGLLRWVREADLVSSFDDEKRYWLIAGTKVFCWDYELSEAKDPSWFYLTGIDAPAMYMIVDTIYHLMRDGSVAVFDNKYKDFDKGFERRYQFSTQYMGTYERLKTVTDMFFTFRTDTDLKIRLTYKTDYETRDDKTDIVSRSWRLVPRNLEWRDLSVTPFAYAARRRPGCRHIRHFTAVLRCTEGGYDMPLLSAQVMYKYEGRDR